MQLVAGASIFRVIPLILLDYQLFFQQHEAWAALELCDFNLLALTHSAPQNRQKQMVLQVHGTPWEPLSAVCLVNDHRTPAFSRKEAICGFTSQEVCACFSRKCPDSLQTPSKEWPGNLLNACNLWLLHLI